MSTLSLLRLLLLLLLSFTSACEHFKLTLCISSYACMHACTSVFEFVLVAVCFSCECERLFSEINTPSTELNSVFEF